MRRVTAVLFSDILFTIGDVTRTGGHFRLEKEELFDCYHCCNKARHYLVNESLGDMLFESFEGSNYFEKFNFFTYRCQTCDCISIWGDFVSKLPTKTKRLFPKGPEIHPSSHKLASRSKLPKKVFDAYTKIWKLKLNNPDVFISQIRKLLEIICNEEGAEGNNLYNKIKYLIDSNRIPTQFSSCLDVLRKVGNLATHDGHEEELSYWEVELVDELFIIIIDYLYLLPAKVDRLKERLKL